MLLSVLVSLSHTVIDIHQRLISLVAAASANAVYNVATGAYNLAGSAISGTGNAISSGASATVDAVPTSTAEVKSTVTGFAEQGAGVRQSLTGQAKDAVDAGIQKKDEVVSECLKKKDEVVSEGLKKVEHGAEATRAKAEETRKA